MSLGHIEFDAINEASLQALIDNAVAESAALEFKRQPYGGREDDKKEFLKDVTGFLNSSGGDLILGMEENNGVASALVPVVDKVEAEIRRMEEMSLACIEPRAMGIRIKAIAVTGGACIVLRIPPSWNPPHRANFGNSKKFWCRRSSICTEMDVEELRILFNRGAAAMERALQWRQERLAAILSGTTPAPIGDEPVLVAFHIAPLSAAPRVAQIPDFRHHIARLEDWRPIWSPSGSSWKYNFEGVLTYGGQAHSAYYLQLFRNGSIEAIQSGTAPNSALPAMAIEEMLLSAVDRLSNALLRVDVTPPLAVMITFMRAHGVRLTATNAPFGARAFDRDIYELPPVVVNVLGSGRHYDRILRPILDAMWQAAGEPGSAHFDNHGNWTGRRS